MIGKSSTTWKSFVDGSPLGPRFDVSYYRFTKPALSDRYLDDAYLANEIFDIWQRSRRTYGSPRVWGQLRARAAVSA